MPARRPGRKAALAMLDCIPSGRRRAGHDRGRSTTMTMFTGTRRGLLIVGALTAFATTAPAAAQEVHVLNWEGWGTNQPFAIEAFEAATGVKVVHDYFTSFPEMFTRMRTNPGYYDVVVINSSYTGAAIDEGLVEPIDTARLKNYESLFPALRDAADFHRDGNTYGVAWVWGATSVSYDTNNVTPAPTSVQVFWDPARAGRVCWHDSPEDSVRMAAIATGQDPENITNTNAVRDKLRALKGQIKTFWASEDEWLKLVAGGQCDVSLIWTDSTEKAKELHGQPITFFIPEEGALGWRDGLSIPTGAPNKDAALAFIDFMTSAEFYGGWAKAGGAPVTASSTAINELSADSLTRQVLTDPANLERLKFQQPLTEEERQAWLELWEETKAFYAE
jgi:spermidine/putrescine transport system substrate-binding protein